MNSVTTNSIKSQNLLESPAQGANVGSSNDVSASSGTRKVPASHDVSVIERKGLCHFNIQKQLSVTEQHSLNESLHQACKQPDLEEMENVLKQGANPNYEGKDRFTPLIRSARLNNISMVELLIRFKADPNGLNFYGMSPLWEAINYGHNELANLLLDNHQADVNGTGALLSVLTGRSENYEQMFYKLFNKLFNIGANLNSDLNNSSTTLLFSALDNQKIRSTLIDNGYDINRTNQHGSTTLHWACTEDSKEPVQWLLKLGADVNHANNNGLTPLYYAVDCVQYDMAECLLDAGACVDTVREGEGSLLRKALVGGIKEGEVEIGGLTKAARKESLEIAKLLILHGAKTIQVPSDEMRQFMIKIGLPEYPCYSLQTLVYRKIFTQLREKGENAMEAIKYPQQYKDVLKDSRSDCFWNC